MWFSEVIVINGADIDWQTKRPASTRSMERSERGMEHATAADQLVVHNYQVIYLQRLHSKSTSMPGEVHNKKRAADLRSTALSQFPFSVAENSSGVSFTNCYKSSALVQCRSWEPEPYRLAAGSRRALYDRPVAVHNVSWLHRRYAEHIWSG